MNAHDWADLLKVLPPTLLAVATLIASISALIVSVITAQRSGSKLDHLHIALNSRLSQLIEQTSRASRAEGVAEGVKTSQDRP
jgi:hypothetical protein